MNAVVRAVEAVSVLVAVEYCQFEPGPPDLVGKTYVDVCIATSKSKKGMDRRGACRK